jgi:RNA polymerase sigma-70 factor (ECF subfamily)
VAASARTETPDEALIAAAARGETRAFDHLLERHEGVVLRVLRLMGVPAQDREDVAQEVFVRAFRHLHGFQHGRSFSAWIYRISVNAAHDYRAGRGRREGESPLDDHDEAADRGHGPEGAARQADLRRRLLRAMEQLTDRERAVFVLRELEGLETREVARSLGISAITVRRHLGRARKRLQEQLGSISSGR